MTRHANIAAALSFLGAFALSVPAAAEPTDVAVRVIAKGAKFVGTSMGGVRVVMRDAETGEILADGVATGSTGDTGRIMTEGLDRSGARWTPGAAQFVARLDLDAPRKIRVEATGPLSQAQAAVTVTSEQWVAPGQPVVGGDAWLLELPGFAVDILSPAAHSTVGGDMTIEANVVMMCGCPLTPGGLWDSDGYELTAVVRGPDGSTQEITLEHAGAPSRFAATWRPAADGLYDITVIAWDEANGNTGVDRTTAFVDRAAKQAVN